MHNIVGSSQVQETIRMLEDKYRGQMIIVGKDKFDPIKGIYQKLLAYEQFLHDYPQWVGKVKNAS